MIASIRIRIKSKDSAMKDHLPLDCDAPAQSVHPWRRCALSLEKPMVIFVVLLALLVPALWLQGQSNQSGSAADDATQVRVAMLTYAQGKTATCFASGFLTEVARQTHIHVAREFSHTTLDPQKLPAFPFIVMTGQDAFTLSDDEQQVLKSYLQRGGFLLASPGCTNEAWNASFRALLKSILPAQPLTSISLDHPLFHTIYNITALPGRKAGTVGTLEGISLNGRLVVVFSDLGLNDTPNAGGGCCCCGGNELRDAQNVNANILAYVLTH
jgi:hypothetical protein